MSLGLSGSSLSSVVMGSNTQGVSSTEPSSSAKQRIAFILGIVLAGVAAGLGAHFGGGLGGEISIGIGLGVFAVGAIGGVIRDCCAENKAEKEEINEVPAASGVRPRTHYGVEDERWELPPFNQEQWDAEQGDAKQALEQRRVLFSLEQRKTREEFLQDHQQFLRGVQRDSETGSRSASCELIGAIVGAIDRFMSRIERPEVKTPELKVSGQELDPFGNVLPDLAKQKAEISRIESVFLQEDLFRSIHENLHMVRELDKTESQQQELRWKSVELRREEKEKQTVRVIQKNLVLQRGQVYQLANLLQRQSEKIALTSDGCNSQLVALIEHLEVATTDELRTTLGFRQGIPSEVDANKAAQSQINLQYALSRAAPIKNV